MVVCTGSVPNSDGGLGAVYESKLATGVRHSSDFLITETDEAELEVFRESVSRKPEHNSIAFQSSCLVSPCELTGVAI